MYTYDINCNFKNGMGIEGQKVLKHKLGIKEMLSNCYWKMKINPKTFASYPYKWPNSCSCCIYVCHLWSVYHA